MKLLLTSSGISNASIENALVDLLGKPIAESSALCIPTGVQPFPGGPSHAYQFISGTTFSPMCGLGWRSVGVLELTALPSIKKEYWMPAVQETDALLVWGGSPLYLCYWMRQSGLADLLPSLRPETVYVGTSGGAMVATPDFGGATYDESEPLTGSDKALGLVELLGKPISESSALCIPTGCSRFPAGLLTSTSSSAEPPEARCAGWVGSRWECWS